MLNDNDWIFRKDGKNISIDDYSNYLIIVVYIQLIGINESANEKLKSKFNNHEKYAMIIHIPVFIV